MECVLMEKLCTLWNDNVISTLRVQMYGSVHDVYYVHSYDMRFSKAFIKSRII